MDIELVVGRSWMEGSAEAYINLNKNEKNKIRFRK